ncbi:sarcolemmal membrane-associated protein isoform X2 [Amyelois transitella]|uniref:sarcolemmal membrane-associated protein isoform X2 n=1 Tax=Amyelois transitella TaxID=680683 RepID=UPI00298F5FED|nr:sarcolemmal membrane-associated protein isoform X2 [Amyelois transitella]
MVVKKKKVKSEMNNTIKNTDYSWTPGPEPPNNQDVGVPRAHFIPHSNSLPFEERRVTLEQPVKIGRNVYRATPSPTNTIFECRVLSRHHATLYYDKGHFYLVDNRSSNGTFINNNRCSISKQQEPHEVFSGDVVQFGIPVVENADNLEKNTFPPVVALLKLYHPDGKEAKLSFNPTMTTPLHLKELYQLNNFVQEAVQREASLETRLRTLRECVERTRAEAEASWELFVGEQRLLMRVHALESMLAMGKQPDAHQVAQLLNDKSNYQEVAQESLRVAHEQRLALEETLERRNREAAALHQNNCTLRLTASNATAELQKLAARCERKMCAARLAIAAAEEKEQAAREHLPLTYSVQNGEAKMLVLSTDSNKLQDAKRSGSLEDAVRALPDYIKLLLPQHVLNKVGIKAISAEGKTAKEFEMILKKNNIYNAENKEKEEDEGVVGGGSDEEKGGEPESCTDDEKQSRLNHDPEHEDSPSGELHADNNANSTYSEQEESPSKAGVEYANILRVMAGLNDEIKALRSRLAAAAAENEQLRSVRDELLAAQPDAAPDAAPDQIQQLQARLAETKEASSAEIQRLSRLYEDLKTQMSAQPTRAQIAEVGSVVDHLKKEITQRDQVIQQLQEKIKNKVTEDKAIETSDSLEDIKKASEVDEPIDTKKISLEIDEMFQLGFEDEDDDTDSAATEIIKDDTAVNNANDTSSSASDFVRLDDEARLQVTLQNGSLHALEEELVRAKESWAEVCNERARLAAQLASLQNKPSARLSAATALALLVPLLAAAFYYMLPYIS